MTMAAIGISTATLSAMGTAAAAGAAISMGIGVIQKKSFGDILKAGLVGGATGAVTGGAVSALSSTLTVPVEQGLDAAIPEIASKAVSEPLSKAVPEAASQAVPAAAAPPGTDLMSTLGSNSPPPPTFGQSATFQQLSNEGIQGVSTEASRQPSLAVLDTPLMDSLNAPTGVDKLGQGTGVPLSQKELMSTDIVPYDGTTSDATMKEIMGSKPVNAQGVDPTAWTKADYTTAINAGSSAINTGVNLAQSPPSGPANYKPNSYSSPDGSGDSLMNSLLNLSRS